MLMLAHSWELETSPFLAYTRPWPVLKLVTKVSPEMTERSVTRLAMPGILFLLTPTSALDFVEESVGLPEEPVNHIRSRIALIHWKSSSSRRICLPLPKSSSMPAWTKSVPREAIEQTISPSCHILEKLLFQRFPPASKPPCTAPMPYLAVSFLAPAVLQP